MKILLIIAIAWIISGLVYANQVRYNCSERGYMVLLVGTKVKCEVIK